jgi:hypothetical protein
MLSRQKPLEHVPEMRIGFTGNAATNKLNHKDDSWRRATAAQSFGQYGEQYPCCVNAQELL